MIGSEQWKLLGSPYFHLSRSAVWTAHPASCTVVVAASLPRKMQGQPGGSCWAKTLPLQKSVRWEHAGRYRQQLWLEKLSITSGSAPARTAFLPYFNTWFRSHCQGKYRCIQLTEVHTTFEPFAAPLPSVPTGTKHQFWPKVPPVDTRIYRI